MVFYNNNNIACKSLLLLVLKIFLIVEADVQTCSKLFSPKVIQEKCCLTGKDIVHEDYKSCLNGEDWNCEISKCLIKKHDILKDEKIDIEKATKFLVKMTDEYPDLKNMTERVKEYCLKDEKYMEYPPDDCYAMKFQVCSFLHSSVVCSSWKDSDLCEDVQQDAKKCKSFIDEN